MSSIATLISSVGFPIAAFVMMYRLYRKEKQKQREEREKWADSIDEHTEVLKEIRRQIAPTRDFYRGGSKNESNQKGKRKRKGD